MTGINHEELCVLCFLSIVIALGVVLAAPETALCQESSTSAPDVMDSRRQGPPFQDFKVKGRAGSADGQRLIDSLGEYGGYGDGKLDNGDFGDGIDGGDGGCDHLDGGPTTDGAGHMWASGLIFFLPIYLLVNQLLM